MKFIDKRADTICILNEALKGATHLEVATKPKNWSVTANANCAEAVQLIRRAIRHLEIVPKTPDRFEDSIS